MKRSRKKGVEAQIRNIRNVLRREGLKAGERYAAKIGVTVPGEVLRSAARWWEKSHHRAQQRKSLGKYGWQLYKLRLEEETHGTASASSPSDES
jgi:hypothetical protein